jgi:hypothetical protein
VKSGRYLAEWSQWSEWSRVHTHGECSGGHLEGLEQARMAQSLGLRTDSQVGVIGISRAGMSECSVQPPGKEF